MAIVRLTFLLLLLPLVGCEEENFPETKGEIPNWVTPYVDRFVWEAEQRGISVDTDHLTIVFERNIATSGNGNQTIVGSCSRSQGNDLVKLDTLNSLWQLSSYLGREEIVFHELGHCLLDRVHRDDKFVSGDFASIMRTIGLLQYGDLDNYTSIFTGPTGKKAHRRDYYIDELFNQELAVPCWSDSNRAPVVPVKEFGNDFIVNREFRKTWVDPNGDYWMFGHGSNYRYRSGIFQILLEGYRITSMTNGPGDQLWMAVVDQQGRASIGTFQSEQLQVVYSQEDLPAEEVTIEELLVDNLNQVWIGDSEADLYLDSGKGFQKVAIPNDIWISSLKAGPQNNVYVLKGGQFYIVENEDTFVQVSSANSDLPSDFFRRLEVDGRGVAWLQAGGPAGAFFQFYPDFSVEELRLNNVKLVEISIKDITTDPQGNIWVATSNGIRKWEGNTFSNYCTYNTGFRILDFNEISVGLDNNIWSIGIDPESSQRKLLWSQQDF